MKAQKFAEMFFAGLARERWGVIDPYLFKWIGEGITAPPIDASEGDMKTWRSIESMKAILEEVLRSSEYAQPTA
jgi:hypothetical protein